MVSDVWAIAPEFKNRISMKNVLGIFENKKSAQRAPISY